MSPDLVYRRADVPVFDPQSLPISALRLAAKTGLNPLLQKTQDPALIAEVLARLKEPGPLTTARPLTTALESNKIYHLELLSARTPGISYFMSSLPRMEECSWPRKHRLSGLR